MDQKKEWWCDVLDQAVEQIPIHEKMGYITALQKCPLHVRTNEANPEVFIKFEDDNVWAAAKRLVKYWEWRVLLFGDAMAYTPILNVLHENSTTTTTSNVFLSHEDMTMKEEFEQMVRDQAMVVLPHRDAHGNHIILYDKSRFQPNFENNIDIYKFLRLVMYNFTIIINRIGTSIRQRWNHNNINKNYDTAQQIHVVGPSITEYHDMPTPTTPSCTSNDNYKESFVAITLVYTIHNQLENIGSNLRDIIQDAIPARFVGFHLCCIASNEVSLSSLRYRLVQNILVFVHSVACRIFHQQLSLQLVPHLCVNKTEVVQHVVNHGFEPSILPVSIGGLWQYPTISMHNQSSCTNINEDYSYSYDRQQHRLHLRPLIENEQMMSNESMFPSSSFSVGAGESYSYPSSSGIATAAVTEHLVDRTFYNNSNVLNDQDQSMGFGSAVTVQAEDTVLAAATNATTTSLVATSGSTNTGTTMNPGSMILTPTTLHQIIPNLGQAPVQNYHHQVALNEYWRQRLLKGNNDNDKKL